MKLIIGLGNPGEEYEFTRHNIGFKVVDAFINKHNLKLNKKKFNGRFYKGDDFIIAKPGTYMNLSGEFVAPLAKFFKIDNDDILVIYDDMDTPSGKASMKRTGSAGGQNGMKDIIDKLGTNNIPRLKVGIGRPKNGAKNHVLGKFTPLQITQLNDIKDDLVKSIEMFIRDGFEKASTYINSK